jgi:hypothetical protein
MNILITGPHSAAQTLLPPPQLHIPSLSIRHKTLVVYTGRRIIGTG